MRKLALATNLFIFLITFTLELTGMGLIAKSRENELYSFITDTGIGWVFVVLYFIFFLVIPAINFIALILKDRGNLIEHIRS